MSQAAAEKHRIPSLDGLRAISITLVIFAHLSEWKHISLPFPANYGTLGVQMFFVLSGFLITSLLLSERERTGSIDLLEFYRRRAYRIFPAAFVFVAIAILLDWHEMRWYHIAAASLYFANMDVPRPWIFGHLWSLGVEEQFYLLWPFLLKKWHAYRVWILCAGFAITPFFISALHRSHARWAPSLFGALPAHTDDLAIGCLVAVLGPHLPRIPKAIAFMMFAMAFAIPLYAGTTPLRSVFEFFVLQPVLGLCLGGILWHVMHHNYFLLNCAPIAWAGRISYSLYLWQEPFCGGRPSHLGYTLILPALGCACASYYLVERPMLRLRDMRARFFQRGTPSVVSLTENGPSA